MLQSMSGAEDRKRALVASADDGPRKRLHSDEAASRSAATPATDDDDDEALHPAYAGLEAFRKEAIYRKLLEARRNLQRVQRTAGTFQDDLTLSEQRTAILQRFWNLLLTDLAAHLAIKDQDAFASLSSSDPRGDLAATEKQLQQQSTAVLEALSTQSDVNVVELQQKVHDLADEASRHKQDLFLTQSKLQRAQDSLAETTQTLSKVEHEYVRYQSNLLRATEGKPTVPAGTTVSASEPAPVTQKTSDPAVVTKDASPSGAAATPETWAALQKAVDDLESARQDVELTRRESDARYAEIQTLNEEVRALKYKLHQTQTKLTTLPEEVLLSSALYRELQASLRHAQHDLQASKEAMQTLETEATSLREDRATFQQTVEAEASTRSEELEKLVKAKENDVTRLRSQRDELNAELTERRSREQVKFTQIEEMKALLNSKEERLTLLSSQVRRLRMTVAAFQGQSETVSALIKAEGEEDQFEQLSRTAQQAQARVAELEKRLGASSRETAVPNGTVKAEEGVAVKADEGAEAKTDSDLRAENERLRLSLQAAEASSKAVDDELEKISAAYADLERQASVKVTDVSRMEEKALRWVTEKSKADNKYFSTMRVKDSLEAELRTAKQVHERQQKTIEKFADVERNYTTQLGLHEKQVTTFKKVVDMHNQRIETLQRELELAESRLAESVRTKEATSESAKELINTANVEKDQRKRAEERIIRLEKDLETAKRQLAKASASSSKSKGRRESEATDGERDHLNSLLQCSSCKEKYRNRILTKCYHTFCSECIDSRVQTRQRKCPHCALAFAVSDVQPLYLQ